MVIREQALQQWNSLQSKFKAQEVFWKNRILTVEQRENDRFAITQQVILSLNNEIDRYIREVHIHPLDPSAASSHYQKLVDNKKRQLNWIKNRLGELYLEE